jgi:hypothetical protein
LTVANSTDDSDENELLTVPDIAKCRLYNFVFQGVFQWIVMTLGILGNCLTCAVVWHDIKKSTMPLLMVNLAIVDNMFLVLICNVAAIRALCAFTDDCVLYKKVSAVFPTAFWPMIATVQLMAIWSIVAITFSRFVSVCWPTRASLYNSRRKVKVRIIAMHACCILFNIPFIIRGYISHDPTGKLTFVLREYTTDLLFKYIYNIFLISAFFYVIPLTLVIYFTIRLCISLREAQKRREEMTSKSRDKADLTFSLVIVVVLFVVCQLTNPIRRLLVVVYPLKSERDCGSGYFYYNVFASLIATFSSASNFFIFCLCARRFRTRFKALFWTSIRIFPKTSLFTVTDSVNVPE